MDNGVERFVSSNELVEPFYLHPLPEDEDVSKHSGSSGFSTTAVELRSDEESSCSYFYLPCNDSSSATFGADSREKEIASMAECRYMKEIGNEKQLSKENDYEKGDRKDDELIAKLSVVSRNQLCIKVEDLKKVHLRKTTDKYNKAASIRSELNSSPNSELEYREDFGISIICPPEMFNDDPERDEGRATRIEDFQDKCEKSKYDVVCPQRCEGRETPNCFLERFPQEETGGDNSSILDPQQKSNFAVESGKQTGSFSKTGEDEVNQLEWLKLYDKILESEMLEKSSESSEDVPWMSELRLKRKLKKK